MRFTTRDLFVACAFIAYLAFIARLVGLTNPFFLVTLVISFALAGTFISWVNQKTGAASAICGGLVCALCLGTIASLAVGALLLSAAVVCRLVPPTSQRTHYYIAMTCIALGLSLSLIPGYFAQRQLAEQRRTFPAESLNNRLAYETTAASNSVPVLDPNVAQRLTTVERKIDDQNYRRWQLEQIHQRQFDHFARSAGFGLIRMAPRGPGSIERAMLEDIAFTPGQFNVADGDSSTFAPPSSMEEIHAASSREFLNPEWFGGIIEPRTKVAGFVEHAFHQNPFKGSKHSRLSVDRVELVSLLKFDAPRVYVLDHLPRMDQLNSDNASTRELDEFEAEALTQLQTDEDFIVMNVGNDYRMLGSLRAANQCLDCHNVQRGELLGAFSYRLTLAERKGDREDASSSDLAADDAPEELAP